MEPTSFLALLAQTRTPTERAAVLGRAAPGYCRTRLLTVTTLDAATAVVARARSLEGGSLDPVAAAWAARTPNPITRARHREQGRALLRLTGLGTAHLPRAVAMGIVAARSDISAEDLARMIGFDDVQAVLESADPAERRAWAAGLLADVRRMAAQVAHMVDPVEIPATGADLVHYAVAR
jgi:urease accessory protein